MDSKETDLKWKAGKQIYYKTAYPNEKNSVDDGNTEFVMLKCSPINIHVHHKYKPYNKMTTPSIKNRQCESL